MEFMQKWITDEIECPINYTTITPRGVFKVPTFNSKTNLPFKVPKWNTNYSLNNPMNRIVINNNQTSNSDLIQLYIS